jgi:hypothetical protein
MTIYIFIKTLCGQIWQMEVDASDHIAQIKVMLTGMGAVRADQQILLLKGRSLQDDKTLQDYSIGDGPTLHMVSRSQSNSYPNQTTSSCPGFVNNSLDNLHSIDLWALSILPRVLINCSQMSERTVFGWRRLESHGSETRCQCFQSSVIC